MRRLGPRVRCTLQIEYPSRIFSKLVAQPAVLAFPALPKHNIHQCASTRQGGPNRRHIDAAKAVELSNTSSRNNDDSSSSLGTPSVAKNSARSAAVPPTREPQPQLDEDPNLFPASPQQRVHVSTNSVIGCGLSDTHKLLDWPCSEGIPCPFYPDRETIPLWE